jgi:carbohydrate-binding DOMON domain-containing protein
MDRIIKIKYGLKASKIVMINTSNVKVFEFIENNGILHYSNCIINNYLDNYKRKINKYTKKYQKYPDSTKYQKIINYYQNKHDEYYEKYSINVKEINDKSKPVYFQISQLYSIFLSKYVKIY